MWIQLVSAFCISRVVHSRKANDAVASEQSIFSQNHDYILKFFRVTVNTYVPIFRGLDAHGGRKLRTDIHSHTRDNYSNDNIKIICSAEAQTHTQAKSINIKHMR